MRKEITVPATAKHTHTPTQRQRYTHTRAHARTHARTCTHTQTHTWILLLTGEQQCFRGGRKALAIFHQINKQRDAVGGAPPTPRGRTTAVAAHGKTTSAFPESLYIFGLSHRAPFYSDSYSDINVIHQNLALFICEIPRHRGERVIALPCKPFKWRDSLLSSSLLTPLLRRSGKLSARQGNVCGPGRCSPSSSPFHTWPVRLPYTHGLTTQDFLSVLEAVIVANALR